MPIIGFPRLAGPMLPEYGRLTGVQALAIDTTMDPRWAAGAVPPDLALQGNLDPLSVVAGGAGMAGEVRGILDVMRGRPFVFNLGHGIEKVTPTAHVAALVAQVRAG